LPKKNPKDSARSRADETEREERAARHKAREALLGAQLFIGVALILSGLFGIYLSATDQSLWILAASHAYGLVAMVTIDLVLGALSIFGVREAYLPSVAAALLGVLLQVGDIATASQYGMTIEYFASYLFGLWAFDALVATQALVMVIALFAWKPLRTVTRATRYSGFSSSRRSFLRAMVASGIVIAVAAAFSALGQSRQSLPTSTPPSQALPSGAVANINDLQSGTPAYFEFPTGYPNILLKKGQSDVLALSLLCTHVCCELNYDSTADELYCPCHGSLFDSQGNVLIGPATVPLPTVQVTIDGAGNIFPKQVNGSSPCNQG